MQYMVSRISYRSVPTLAQLTFLLFICIRGTKYVAMQPVPRRYDPITPELLISFQRPGELSLSGCRHIFCTLDLQEVSSTRDGCYCDLKCICFSIFAKRFVLKHKLYVVQHVAYRPHWSEM